MCPSRTGGDERAARSGIDCSAVTGFGQPRSMLRQKRTARALSTKEDRPEHGAAIGDMFAVRDETHCCFLRCRRVLEMKKGNVR
jgi:hypothetical protein